MVPFVQSNDMVPVSVTINRRTPTIFSCQVWKLGNCVTVFTHFGNLWYVYIFKKNMYSFPFNDFVKKFEEKKPYRFLFYSVTLAKQWRNWQQKIKMFVVFLTFFHCVKHRGLVNSSAGVCCHPKVWQELFLRLVVPDYGRLVHFTPFLIWKLHPPSAWPSCTLKQNIISTENQMNIGEDFLVMCIG